jgi:hypothetical protein
VSAAVFGLKKGEREESDEVEKVKIAVELGFVLSLVEREMLRC